MFEVIHSPKAPAAIGPYSQATRVGDTLYISGTLPFHPETGELEADEIKVQARRSLNNMKAVLEEAGGTFADIVMVNVLLSSIADFAALNEVYTEFFSEPYPARATYQVAALPKGARIEVIAVAHLG